MRQRPCTGGNARSYPQIREVLKPVFAGLDLATLRDLNEKVAVEGNDPGAVAREFFRAQGLFDKPIQALDANAEWLDAESPRPRSACARCLGFAGILLGGFLNFAPNRLASGVAYAICASPGPCRRGCHDGALRAGASELCPGHKLRSAATILAAALIFWGSLRAPANLAALLMQAGPPAARASLGPAFWILISVALLAIVDAVQRGTFGYPARVGVGAAFCAGFVLMARRAPSIIFRSRRNFRTHGAVSRPSFAPSRACRRGDSFRSDDRGAAHRARLAQEGAWRVFVFASLGILQTIPSIALFGVLIAPMSR